MNRIFLKNFIGVIIGTILLFMGATMVFAATGTISPSSKYSQFLDLDYDSNGTDDFINWAPTNGTAVSVTDTAITGEIWGESVGWINLAPTQSGVTNTCDGELGGYAWGENTGWINFNPTQATGANDPQINTTTGAITGTVWSENYGYIQLSSPDVTYPGLTTTWTGCDVVSTGGGTSSGSTPYVFGCMDPAASNYNPSATASNMSCIYAPQIVPVTPIVPPVTVNPSPTPGQSNPSIPPQNSSQNPTPLPVYPPEIPPLDYCDTIPGIQSSPSSCPDRFVEGDAVFAGFLSSLGNVFEKVVPRSTSPFLTFITLLGLLGSIPGIITRVGNLVLTFIFVRKKQRGIVYDSQTKEPLDPAYLSVVDIVSGKEVATAITDMEGRFGFVLKKGSYKIVANKTHYQFPSTILAGRDHDEVYDNLYFGDVFTIEDDEAVITMNIPMDSLGTDWNQEEKRRMSPLKYLINNQAVIAHVVNILFVIGFVVSLVITYYYPVWWNILMVILYILIAIMQSMGYGPISPGKITKTSQPLPYAIVRIYNSNLNREVAHKVTSELGGYYALVPKADYYLTIEQKNPDGTYTKVHTSETFKAHHGMINESFDVSS